MSSNKSPMFQVEQEPVEEEEEVKEKTTSRPSSRPGKKTNKAKKTHRELTLEGILRGLLDVEPKGRSNPKTVARYVRLLKQRHGPYILGED